MQTKHFSLPDIDLYQELSYWSTVHGTRMWYLLLGCGALLGLLLIYVAYRFIKVRKPKTLSEWKDEQLKLLDEMLASPVSSYEEFYVQVTFFLKEYLYRVVGLPVNTVTDTELLDAVASWTRSKKVIAAIEEIVVMAQSIKFAQEHGMKVQAQKTLKSLKLILNYAPILNEKEAI